MLRCQLLAQQTFYALRRYTGKYADFKDGSPDPIVVAKVQHRPQAPYVTALIRSDAADGRLSESFRSTREMTGKRSFAPARTKTHRLARIVQI
jgi:hypothetical protein